MVATLIECPYADEGCEVTTDDTRRGRDSTMGLHIQSTHARRHCIVACATCKQEGAPNHDPSYRCESGWERHCSCDTCF